MSDLKREIYLVSIILIILIFSSSGMTRAQSPEDGGVAPSLIEIPDTLDDPADKIKTHKKPSVPAPSNASDKSKNFHWSNYDPRYNPKPSKNADQNNTSKPTKKTPQKGETPKSNVDMYGNTTIKGASSDLPLKLVINKEKKIKIEVKSKQYPVTVRSTNVDDEYLVPVDDSGIKSIVQVIGANNWRWNKDNRAIIFTYSGRSYTFRENQMELPQDVGGRQLDVGIRNVDGVYYFPISILEDFFKVRVTIKEDKGRGWIDPLISSVRLEGTGRNLTLNVRSTYPVSYKTFRLSQPNRYVIDFYGGVLDTSSLNINHPEMGDIRLGQFSLAPAISRIVIPTTLDVGVTPPVNTTGQNFNFALNLPKVGSSTKYVQEKVLNYDIGVNNKNGLSTSSVVLYFSGPVQYEWRRLTEGKDRFMVDLKRVVFPENKVSKSVGGNLVDKVRISQYATSPIPVTRLVFDLKDCVAVNVGSGINDNCLVINISSQVIDPKMTAVRGEGATAGTPFMRGTGKTICIDPGHGGSDSGCLSQAYGHMEKTVTLDVCLKLANILRQRGWNVIMTRETDRDVTYAGSSNTEELDARAQVGNRNNTDIFISVHCNAAANTAAEGTSLHVYKRGDRVLAQSIHPNLLKATGRMDRGIHQDRFYVLVHTNMPAVLVETAFLTNSNEAKLLGSEEYRLRIAQGLAEGICNYGDQYLRK